MTIDTISLLNFIDLFFNQFRVTLVGVSSHSRPFFPPLSLHFVQGKRKPQLLPLLALGKMRNRSSFLSKRLTLRFKIQNLVPSQ
jgi:hypothetical protein